MICYYKEFKLIPKILENPTFCIKNLSRVDVDRKVKF